MKKTPLFVILIGLTIRGVCLMFNIQEWASRRVEVVTSLNAFDGVKEGLFLSAQGQDVYGGSNVHHGPMLIAFFQVLERIVPDGGLFEWATQAVFVCVDVFVGLVARELTLEHLGRIKGEVVGDLALAIGILHPFAILSGLARTSSGIGTLIVLLGMLNCCRGKVVVAMALLALGSHVSIHFVLLFPAFVLWGTSDKLGVGQWMLRMSQFVAFFGLFVGVGFLIMGDLGFVGQTMLFQIGMEDMRPNLGLWWYFFLEIFQHFRPFFLFVSQLSTVIFVVPLAIRINRNPGIMAMIVVMIVCAFKSYPTFGDYVLYSVLMPMHWEKLTSFMRNVMVWSSFLMSAVVLEPVFWFEWIERGAGNANFLYATSMINAMGHLLMITDVTRSAVFLQDEASEKEEKEKEKVE